MKKLIYMIMCLLILVSCASRVEENVENIPENHDTPEIVSDESIDLTELWSYGLTSIRTGEPLIEEGNEHNIDVGSGIKIP